jgi:hypothetical protein
MRTFYLVIPLIAAGAAVQLDFRLVDVTSEAGLRFTHDNGAKGKKFLPETMGPGCAFLDYNGDGWQDILLVNSASPSGLYRNNRNGTFSDVTRQSGLTAGLYGMGVAAADFDNDGHTDIFLTGVGQNKLFRNTGKGTFVDVTKQSGLGGRESFSSSALWFDYDRDGLLDLFVANYVRWKPELDVFCSLDGKSKSYCTPEAYRGTTCWLFRNAGNGRFIDVTVQAGLFDSSSKSLGVSAFDYDNDGWPDLFVANDTQPNKLYRNLRDGRFQEIGVRAGVAFSEDGKARAGMGVDVADLDNSGIAAIAVTNFQNEMLGLYRGSASGSYTDSAPGTEIGVITRRSLGFGCFFFDANLDGGLDLVVVNGHIDSTFRDVDYAQPPHLFLRQGDRFQEVAAAAGAGFAAPKVGRGAAYGDYDRDGDLDVLITTNGGPAKLYRNDLSAANKRFLRLTLKGTKSNRVGIGATIHVYLPSGERSTRTVKSGGSYLSQSELPVTFGLGRQTSAAKVVVHWPSGVTDERGNVAAGAYEWVEGTGPVRK